MFHNFISEDGTCKINLTSSFISISTLEYNRWEELLERFKKPVKSFLDIFQPIFFERVGLRYVDAFNKKKLGLERTPWKELIEEHLLGSFAVKDEKKIKTFNMDEEYELDSSEFILHVHTGLGKIKGDRDNSFLIDSDFYKIGKTGINDIENIGDILHKESAQFFQEAIKGKLHDAMGPKKI